MAERLTDKNHEAINKCGEFSSCYSCKKEICYITEVCEKLGKLEDILEKYGIESVEELGKKLADGIIWERACKEACDVLRDINYKIYNEDRIDFENIFYQQVTGKLPAN